MICTLAEISWDFSQYVLHLASHFNRLPTWSALMASQFYECGDRHRALGRSKKNPEQGQYWCGGHNLPPLVEIGLTDLPKSGVAMATPAPLAPSGLQACRGADHFKRISLAQIFKRNKISTVTKKIWIVVS